MREGKLFRIEFGPHHSSPGLALAGSAKPARRVEHFWLCGACSTTLTVVMNNGGVKTVPVVIMRAAAS